MKLESKKLAARNNELESFLKINNLNENEIENIKSKIFLLDKYLSKHWINQPINFENEVQKILKDLTEVEQVFFLYSIRIFLFKFFEIPDRRPINDTIRFVSPTMNKILFNMDFENLNNGLYTIAKRPLRFYFHRTIRGKITGESLQFNPINSPRKETHSLNNYTLYFPNGSIKQQKDNPSDYDEDFVNRIIETSPKYFIPDFLEYHYSNTSDKGLFIKHIKYHIVKDIDLRQDDVEQINLWLEEKITEAKSNSEQSNLPTKTEKKYGKTLL